MSAPPPKKSITVERDAVLLYLQDLAQKTEAAAGRFRREVRVAGELLQLPAGTPTACTADPWSEDALRHISHVMTLVRYHGPRALELPESTEPTEGDSNGGD